ncbi:MAG: hypothetical protein HQ546_10700 [Planctomycetes bacterium]|nr:hypothetical protein [Planctomycetota bacterium]
MTNLAGVIRQSRLNAGQDHLVQECVLVIGRREYRRVDPEHIELLAIYAAVVSCEYNPALLAGGRKLRYSMI